MLYLICPLRVSGCGDLVLTTLSETHSRSPQITVLKLFAKTINEFFPLAIFSKKKLSFDNFSIRFYLPSMKPTLMWWGDSSNYEASSRVSTRRARRSDAATFNKNWHSVNHLHGNAKDLQRYCFKIRIIYFKFPIQYLWDLKGKEFRLEQPCSLLFIFLTCRFWDLIQSERIYIEAVFLSSVYFPYLPVWSKVDI